MRDFFKRLSRLVGPDVAARWVAQLRRAGRLPALGNPQHGAAGQASKIPTSRARPAVETEAAATIEESIDRQVG